MPTTDLPTTDLSTTDLPTTGLPRAARRNGVDSGPDLCPTGVLAEGPLVPAASTTPLVVGLAFLVVLAAIVVALVRSRSGRRLRREQRWSLKDVETTVRGGEWTLPHGMRGTTPSVDVRVEIRGAGTPLQFEEVEHAYD